MTIIPTFATFVDGQVDLSDPQAVEEVDAAWAQYDQAIWALINEMRDDPDRPGSFTGFLDVVAEDIISAHLGPEWYAEHVNRPGGSDLADGYLYEDGPPAVLLLSKHRQHELARRLYELQSFPWFAGLVERLATRDLSGAGFELDVLRHLLTLVRADAREEIGVKGQDYDIAVYLADREVPIEAKAKDDATEFSEGTVIHTLKGAAQQLPKGEKGIVFLRIPPGWVGPGLEDRYLAAVHEGTRQTSRVSVVVTAIDKVHLRQDQSGGHVSRHFHLFRHQSCPELDWEFARRLDQLLATEVDALAPSAPF